MVEHEHDQIVRSEIETPPTAPDIHAIIGAVLVAMLVGLLAFQFWPAGNERSAVTSSSPVYRAPTTPPIVKSPTDTQQIVPKSKDQ